MDEATRKLKGSPSRDTFKQKHKQLSKSLYACDLDFVLVSKKPDPCIVAALDYKASYDKVTFSEVIAYNSLKAKGIRVYIVEGGRDAEPPFSIKRWDGGNHLPFPPVVNLTHVFTAKTWAEFEWWEKQLRAFVRKAVKQ